MDRFARPVFAWSFIQVRPRRVNILGTQVTLCVGVTFNKVRVLRHQTTPKSIGSRLYCGAVQFVWWREVSEILFELKCEDSYQKRGEILSY